MTIQADNGEILVYKKNTGTYGALPGPTGGKKLRHIDHTLGLTKSLLEPNEKRSDYQKAKSRHGMRNAGGNVNGLLSPGTYADLIASACRRDFAAVAALAALTNVTASATAPHFVRATGDWIAAGLRVGMTIRMTGWATTGVGNNNKNFTVTALTATGITVAETVAAKAAGDSVVVSIPGKTTFIPATGHTDDDYAFESWMPDAPLSRRILGSRVNTVELSMTPDAYVGINIGVISQDVARDPAVAYFTSPAAESTTDFVTSVSGDVYVQGVKVATITNLTCSIDNGRTAAKATGSAVISGAAGMPISVKGNLTAYLDSPTFYGFFDDETDITLIWRWDASESVLADFVGAAVPKATVATGTISKDANLKTISFDWSASRGGGGATGWEDTTIMFQDSAA